MHHEKAPWHTESYLLLPSSNMLPNNNNEITNLAPKKTLY